MENHQRIPIRKMRKYFKGTVAQSFELNVTKGELQEATKAANARKKRQQVDRRHVQTGGVLYASDARAAVLAKDSPFAKGTSDGAGDTQSQPSEPAPFTIIQWQMPKNGQER
ncbi:hypothetical protein BU26DRAFT_508487 [Trematosphaeria pertusa]|uniref:Uncharacterized protein n=1 Tax=Trematosphaeria pertusa TaxID=390896 RepID=A0A6A6I5D0_9PLEO|nr:uncharacterized protein BU26DRAFT_508487 [Trematosphaeria pertusa]KAF2245162.1 hypothetical protein BU26DRAFT_508487 [Trematosphaeria pertusa]